MSIDQDNAALSRIRRALISLDLDHAEHELEALGDAAPARAGRLRASLEYNRSSPETAFLSTSSMKPWSSDQFAGMWRFDLTDTELSIVGHVLTPVPRVAIFVNHRVLKVLNTTEKVTDGLKVHRFAMTFKRSILSRLPPHAAFSIASEAGPLAIYSPEGKLAVQAIVEFSGATDELFPLLSKGYYVSKHGGLLQRQSNRADWQDNVLAAYGDFAKYFTARFDYPLVMIYGSLLGFVRDNDFIDHDDDFDVAYLSREVTPEGVREEMKRLVGTVQADGRSVSFPGNRAFFKYHGVGAGFDVFPGWIESGRLWMNNSTSIEADRGMFEPAQETKFKGRCVYVPNDPVQFLERKYGPGWIRPDPGYQFAAKPPGTDKHLGRARLSVEEAAEFDK